MPRKIVIPKGLWLNSSNQTGYGLMSKTPAGSGVFLFALFIIAGGRELIRHVNVLDWRGFLGFGGLTGFWGLLRKREDKNNADPLRG
jgi:hypothetical protein